MTLEVPDMPESLRRARALTRDIEPPPEMQPRVRRAVDAARAGRSPKPWLFVGVLATAALGLALIVASSRWHPSGANTAREMHGGPPAAESLHSAAGDRAAEDPIVPTETGSPETAPALATVMVLEAERASADGADIEQGAMLAEGAIVTVAVGGHVRLALASATLDLEPGSSARVRRDGVRVTSGVAIVLGDAYMEAGPCHAAVRGRGRVTVDESGAHYRILEASPHGGPDDVCWFEVDLAAPDLSPTAPAPSDATRPSSVRGEAGSDLAAMMEAVAEARTLRDRDDGAALARWREIRRRWPGRGLDEEVDLYIVDALVGLDDGDGARREARRFLTRHPSSAHAERMRALIADAATETDATPD